VPIGRLGRHWLRPFAQLYSEHEVANVDFVAFPNNGCLRNLAPVDVRAVGAFQIGKNETTVSEQQPSMVLRNVSFREHEVVRMNTTNVDLVFVEAFCTLRSALFMDDYREHAFGPFFAAFRRRVADGTRAMRESAHAHK
jgi:hypothetical protein